MATILHPVLNKFFSVVTSNCAFTVLLSFIIVKFHPGVSIKFEVAKSTGKDHAFAGLWLEKMQEEILNDTVSIINLNISDKNCQDEGQ